MDEYPIQGNPTPFEDIYNRFLGLITDDMYLEWTKEDTLKDMKNILLQAIPGFEFPRFPLYDYDSDLETFGCHLTSEEVNIFALLMYNVWLQRQVASVENTRMKYSGADFKMTSQANHLAKLMELKREAERQDHHMQRLYKRRKLIDKNGSTKSNWSTLMETSTFDS